MGKNKAEKRKGGFCCSLDVRSWVCVGLRLRALTLSSLEVRFHIDSETHDPIDLQAKELL